MKYDRAVSFLNRFFLVGILITGACYAQQQSILTVEWIFSDAGKEVASVPYTSWLSDGTALLYDTHRSVGERSFEILDPATGTRRTALDMKRALASLGELLPQEEVPAVLPWPEQFNAAGTQALYRFKGDLFLLDLASSSFQRTTATPQEEICASFSPDGRSIAFVRENDLYLYDIANRTESRLTRDGSETTLNGTLSWVYWEEIFGRHDIGYWWSEDSQAIALLQSDESPVDVTVFVDFKPATPRVIRQRYPKAGTTNPRVRVGIIELAGGPTTWVQLAGRPYEYIARVQWLPDSRRLSFQTLSRDQTRMDLYFADRATGALQHVLTESDPGWVNIHDDLRFLKDGRHFLWASERDGYQHLYRYKLEGTLANRITQGEWAVASAGGDVYWLRRAIVGVDEGHDWIYFTALEKSSIQRHLYRIHSDGSGRERLTQEEGAHSISMSPDARYYWDTYSDIRTLPRLALHEAGGKVLQVVAAARPELLADFDMQYPELLTIPAADGFPMPAQLSKPKDFQTGRRYPVILYVYGGPSAPTVVHAWQRYHLYNQLLLREGYLVLQVDNRCATAISKRLENTILRRSGEPESDDLLAAVRWLKSQPYVDPGRVGIWGWSGGGTMTLNAMTRSKEFKAGISVAPVTDWHYYDSKWAEAFMKRPSDNPEGYEQTSLVKRAKDLHGRLLLVYGTYDDNVHPQNAQSFIDELVAAGKMFDAMIYPMRKHGIGDRPASIHLFRTMLEFWKKNL